jgi:hypothetical protein
MVSVDGMEGRRPHRWVRIAGGVVVGALVAGVVAWQVALVVLISAGLLFAV